MKKKDLTKKPGLKFDYIKSVSYTVAKLLTNTLP